VFMAYGLVGVVLGARLGHCLFYDLQRCLASPLTVLEVWEGRLASHGATVGLAAALLLFAWHNRIPLAEVTDRFSIVAALGACTIRIANIANFLNSEIVGRVTDGGWGVRFPPFDRGLPLDQVPLRHPSQLYEAALGLAVLVVLLLVDRRYKERRARSRGATLECGVEHARGRPRGLLSALFLTLYFAGRIAVELFKERQTLPHFPLSMGQLLSLPPLAVGLWWLLRLRRPPRPRATCPSGSARRSS